MVIDNLKSIYHWNKVQSKYWTGEMLLEGAFSSVAIIESYFKLTEYQRAFKAVLLIRLGQYEEATAILGDIIEVLRGSEISDDVYILNYSKYCYHGLIGDNVAAVGARKKAEALLDVYILKKWLRFPPSEFD